MIDGKIIDEVSKVHLWIIFSQTPVLLSHSTFSVQVQTKVSPNLEKDHNKVFSLLAPGQGDVL